MSEIGSTRRDASTLLGSEVYEAVASGSADSGHAKANLHLRQVLVLLRMVAAMPPFLFHMTFASPVTRCTRCARCAHIVSIGLEHCLLECVLPVAFCMQSLQPRLP
jgi:hypothetical protein